MLLGRYTREIIISILRAAQFSSAHAPKDNCKISPFFSSRKLARLPFFSPGRFSSPSLFSPYFLMCDETRSPCHLRPANSCLALPFAVKPSAKKTCSCLGPKVGCGVCVREFVGLEPVPVYILGSMIHDMCRVFLSLDVSRCIAPRIRPLPNISVVTSFVLAFLSYVPGKSGHWGKGGGGGEKNPTIFLRD